MSEVKIYMATLKSKEPSADKRVKAIKEALTQCLQLARDKDATPALRDALAAKAAKYRVELMKLRKSK